MESKDTSEPTKRDEEASPEVTQEPEESKEPKEQEPQPQEKKKLKREKCVVSFRYRSIRKNLTFYVPTGGKRISQAGYDNLVESTHQALVTVFGEVVNYLIGVANYIQGPVVPLSVLVKRPQMYCRDVLDLILDDECPFLFDIQIPASSYAAASVAAQREATDGRGGHTWLEIQSRLSVPRNIPIKTVHPIDYSRLLDYQNKANFNDFFIQYLRFFGYAFVKLPPNMVKKYKKYTQIWDDFFDNVELGTDTTLPKYNIDNGEKSVGGYYDETDRQMFHLVPMLMGCTPPWPRDPVFQKKAIKLFFLLETVAKTALIAVSRGIGVDPALFLDVCDKEFSSRLYGSSCRVCRYKKQEENTGVICTEHTDTTILTVGPASKVPELQFYDKINGEWVYVEDKVDDSHVVIFVGNILARMTAGYFQPTFHSVP